jgi:hypothetical protein
VRQENLLLDELRNATIIDFDRAIIKMNGNFDQEKETLGMVLEDMGYHREF